MHLIHVPFVASILVIGVIGEWVRGIGKKINPIIGVDSFEKRILFQGFDIIENFSIRDFKDQAVYTRSFVENFISQSLDKGFLLYIGNI